MIKIRIWKSGNSPYFSKIILPIVVIWLRIWGACSVISAFIAFDIIEINDPKNDKPTKYLRSFGAMIVKFKIVLAFQIVLTNQHPNIDKNSIKPKKNNYIIWPFWILVRFKIYSVESFFFSYLSETNFETIPLHFSRWSAAKFRGGSGDGFKYKNKHFLLSSWYLKLILVLVSIQFFGTSPILWLKIYDHRRKLYDHTQETFWFCRLPGHRYPHNH